jgi:alpha-L-fucosidase
MTTVRVSRRRFLFTLPVSRQLAANALEPVGAPASFGAIPSQRQLRWHELEYYAFLHFSVNTFTGLEWGYGDEDPSVFSPTAFDPDAIVSDLRAGAARGVILTCKHHDGFCLWPTRTTEHCIRNSKWRDGKADVVREIAEAARRQGLKFGVYLSPWDRNSALYGSPQYPELYRAQLRELLTQYGPLFEVWHDGANGGDGYYGGAREKRLIDKRTYYDWPKTWNLVRELQPDAAIFSDVGPDIRWVGNEAGHAAETCWATYDPAGRAVGDARPEESERGSRGGVQWLPPECDVSIRPGWFWHAAEDLQVKAPSELLSLYYQSAGRGGNLLLNIPPDRRGLLSAGDAASLRGFGDLLHRTFGRNFAAGAKVDVSNVRGNQTRFGGENLVAGDRYKYWATDDGVTTPNAVIWLGRDVQFNVVRLREDIRLGQRIDAVEIDLWKAGAWETFAKATSVGACRLLKTRVPVSTDRVRLRITQAAVSPALSDFGLFLEAH